MKKTILILSMVVLSFASQAQGIYNNGARIVGTTGSYWVVDNGDFALTSASATNLAQFANFTITGDASLTLGMAATPAYLTVSGTLTNNSGDDGLVISPGSSLIESSGVTAMVTFNIAADEWHLISFPTSNATSGIFYGHYLQQHDEADNAFTDIIDPGEELTPMKGYAIWGDLDPAEVTFVGPLNAGSYSFNTTRVGAGWNLVGNPYPSSIDWDAASGWTKTNVNSATYCHVSSSTWATWVPGSPGIGTNNGSRFIAPGQGFFVEASSNGTLAVTDAVRVHNATTFFKSSKKVAPNLVRLEVSGNGYKDEAVVRFLQEASAEFDGDYDAHKLYGDEAGAAQIYSAGSSALAINSLPETDIVPVGVKIGLSGTYTIAATEINDMQYVTLEDTQTGIFTELAKSPYTFSFEAGENELRFKLHFSALGIDDNQPEVVNIFSHQKTVFVNLKGQVEGDIFIYNICGQMVAFLPAVSGSNRINLENTGTYIAKVVSDKSMVIRKVFIQ